MVLLLHDIVWVSADLAGQLEVSIPQVGCGVGHLFVG
jgi:hypothetical protein